MSLSGVATAGWSCQSKRWKKLTADSEALGKISTFPQEDAEQRLNVNSPLSSANTKYKNGCPRSSSNSNAWRYNKFLPGVYVMLPTTAPPANHLTSGRQTWRKRGKVKVRSHMLKLPQTSHVSGEAEMAAIQGGGSPAPWLIHTNPLGFPALAFQVCRPKKSEKKMLRFMLQNQQLAVEAHPQIPNRKLWLLEVFSYCLFKTCWVEAEFGRNFNVLILYNCNMDEARYCWSCNHVLMQAPSTSHPWASLCREASDLTSHFLDFSVGSDISHLWLRLHKPHQDSQFIEEACSLSAQLSQDEHKPY